MEARSEPIQTVIPTAVDQTDPFYIEKRYYGQLFGSKIQNIPFNQWRRFESECNGLLDRYLLSIPPTSRPPLQVCILTTYHITYHTTYHVNMVI